MRFILLALAATLVGSNAAGQHCWPSSIALVVSDARGAVLDLERLDSIAYSPEPGDDADFAVGTRRIDVTGRSWFEGSTPALLWQGRGDCRVDVREVVLRRGEEVMRLWMDLHIATQRRPGPSAYLLRPPPFAAGTWRLDVCELPFGKTGGRAEIPPRWVRVSASGDPGTPWQAPQGCGANVPR
ncbi:MAG TPA: hypothetical protein VEX86_21395 [Longimicrobium sp.]|nr:hypothetical protein [Longimicrobium sp.]